MLTPRENKLIFDKVSILSNNMILSEQPSVVAPKPHQTVHNITQPKENIKLHKIIKSYLYDLYSHRGNSIHKHHVLHQSKWQNATMSRFVMNDIWRKLQNNDACDKKSVNNIAAHQTEDKSRSSCAGCVAVSYHLWHQVLSCKSKSLSLFPVHLYSNTSISADNDLRFHLIIDSGVRWDWNVCAGTDAAFTSRFLLKKKNLNLSKK